MNTFIEEKDFKDIKDLLTVKVFYLYFILDLKLDEISKELNINISTVKNKIYRTLKDLKKYLGKDVM